MKQFYLFTFPVILAFKTSLFHITLNLFYFKFGSHDICLWEGRGREFQVPLYLIETRFPPEKNFKESSSQNEILSVNKE